MPFEIGQQVLFNGKELTIVDKVKGNKTNKPNYAGGIVFTGYKSKACKYILSDGSNVRGCKLKKITT